jgi:hypothetical protein
MPTVGLSPIFNGWQGFDTNGVPLNGGFIYSYQAGSSTPQPTYTTIAGSVTNSNPIQLGVDGRPPQEIWLDVTLSYKFLLTDSLSNQIAPPYDNITASVTGTTVIPISQGGTGQITASAALAALGGAKVTGDATQTFLVANSSPGTQQAIPRAQADALYATIDSPHFTGIPTAPTATPGDNTTQLATDAFVQAAIAAATGSGGTLIQLDHQFTAGAYTFNSPAGALKAWVRVVGGGGHGEGPGPGAGGSGGGYSEKIYSKTGSWSISGAVGAAGASTTATDGTTMLTATGGANNGGAAGTGTNGNINFTGQVGEPFKNPGIGAGMGGRGGGNYWFPTGGRERMKILMLRRRAYSPELVGVGVETVVYPAQVARRAAF